LGNIATSAAANTEALMAMADELRIELDQYFAQARMVKNVAFAVVEVPFPCPQLARRRR
jgi:hypothetical protein